MKEQEVIKRLNFHKEYARLYSSRVVMISETDLETALNMLKEKDKEIEKKDRQIDLMAETIRKLAISLANYKGSYNKETINFTGNKGIKQYFERKVKK